MAPRKRQRSLMPNFLKTNPDEPPEGFDELNQQLKILPADVNVPSDSETRRSESRSDAEEETIQSKRRRRIDDDTTIKLSDFPPLEGSFILPSLQMCRVLTRPAEKKRSVPPKHCEDVPTKPSCGGSCVDEASESVSGRSDITKVDVMNKSPLDHEGVKGFGTSEDIKSVKPKVTMVYSFKDLITMDLRTFRSFSHVNHKKLGISVDDVVEPMKCDEGVKCEANADSMSLEKLNKRDVEPMKCDEASKCEVNTDSMSLEKLNKRDVDVVDEAMKCDEGVKCEANTDLMSLEKLNKRDVDVVDEAMKCDEGVKCEANTDLMSLEKLNKRDVDVVELMKGDEESKCEVNTDLMSLEKLSKRDVYVVEPMKCNEESKCQANNDSVSLEKLNKRYVDVVEPTKCDEESECEANADSMSLKKLNKRDVSLMEGFTEELIKLHIKSLKEGSSSQNKIREICDPNEEESCQLCGDGKLLYPPPPIYCTSCSQRIKDNAFYYTPEEEELSDAQQYQICNPCYSHCRSKFKLYGTVITKANMHKKSNVDNQIAEEWVACESCQKWQHQICGLYNKEKDVDNTADYICPNCLLEERKSSNDKGFDDSKNLGAEDLPETILSEFIHQRLVKRLEEERQQTAEATEKSINEVLEPEDLTLRVVYSADKTSVVNKQLVDLLQKENYPSEFPYKSKVILLFQKVDGVDVCIFALFVQEFGSECSLPNQRSTYILYLDSVKYFRPERVTFAGEALRTFVYHEILIGYLEYCKLRGFTTGYIWACPPPKGEDYIMYSHPKTQQTPNTKKLRQWYVTMLEKAAGQRVVTNVTNLYDRFFVPTPESTSNMTAARLPYFEGSFWSYNAELLIQEIEKEGNDELPKKVKSLSRRKLKSMSYYNSTDSIDINDAKNILLMQKLEKMVFQNKDDFMVVELNYSCTRCSKAILSGFRWCCNKCKNHQLCESCYEAEQEVPGEFIHTVNGKEKHQLSKVQVERNSILSTTEDDDAIQENNIFESRQAFLSFSHKHNYNFDTLRRAKHSSMMILHHLHTSNKHHGLQDSFHVTCTNCKKDVSTVYYPCFVCPDYQVCTGCYNKHTNLRNRHLFPELTTANGKRTVLALETLNTLSHLRLCLATRNTGWCRDLKCWEVRLTYCHNVKEFNYPGCNTCDDLKRLIKIDAYHCQDLTCRVPRCCNYKDIFTALDYTGK